MTRVATNNVDAERTNKVGRDLESYVRGEGGDYDSVVIVGGNGITTHTFAARLARDDKFAGKVVLAGQPKEENRRLIGGVSLRAKGADVLGYATGLTHTEIVEQIAQGRSGSASTRQVAAMAEQGEGDGWQFSKPGPWQNHRNKSDRPIMYGFRNSRMAVAVRDTIADGAVQFVEEAPQSLSDLRDLALGSRPLIVNGTNDDQLLGNAPSPRRWGIIAAQVPFAEESLGNGPLEPSTTFAPLVRREGAIDVGYYTPFYDPLSPRAGWYGIIARPVPAHELNGARGDHHKRLVTDELLGIGEACGLSPVDPAETMGVAAVPGADWAGPGTPIVPGTFELKQACSAGIPAYYADGILNGAMGGLVAAEAILRGADPTASATAALAKVSRWNRLWWLETTKLAPVADKLMRLNVSAAMAFPHSSSANLWASAA